jgi:hypothetical protein
VGCKDGMMQKKFQDIKKNGILNVTILLKLIEIPIIIRKPTT